MTRRPPRGPINMAGGTFIGSTVGQGSIVSHNMISVGTAVSLDDLRMPQLTDPDEAFAERYRKSVAGFLDRFEFFGADPRGITRRHSFDDGYVPLTLNQRDQGEDGTISMGSRADQALADHRRALVRGVAGAGKSTLLRWLAVDVARDRGEPRDEPPAVPFVLELGRFAGGRLPELDQLVAAPLRPEMPDGWVHRMLADDRVVLLLEGLDEVHPREREYIEDWVEEHLNAHPGTRCIVTTRPSVVAEQWWVDRGFQRFDLLPMSRHSIEEYVHGWHSATRVDYPDTPAWAEARESLTGSEWELLATLPNRPALHGMSANPLLCGLLCALHLDGKHLPDARKEVYDAALDLLLERWPRLRRWSRAATEREADAGIDLRLSKEERVKLLQRLAFWLVANRQRVLSPDIARQRVQACMAGLHCGDEDPERVRQYLAEESGLLREQPDGSLEFVYRTFRDHLAAKEVVEESNLTLMLDNADKLHWHDVVVMAGAHTRPAERESILRELLARGQADPEHRDTLYLLAAAILEQSTVLPPRDPRSPDVRALVTAAMAQLIPPQTSAAADQLAAVGPFILDLLPGPDGLTAHGRALVVRATAQIAARWNPPGAIEKILQFTEGRAGEVLTELLETWGRHGDSEAYAREVLSEIDFSRFNVQLQNQYRIDHIGQLRTITTLTLLNDIRDLRSLAELPRLRRLTLRNNTVTNLERLEAARSLQIVRLEGCSSIGGRPVDLSPLAGLRLRKLVISGLGTRVDLESLAGARLYSLSLSGSALRDSPALLHGLRVEHLTLTRLGCIDLSRVHGLRTVNLVRAPTQDELAALARLPDLRRSHVPHGTSALALPGVEVVVCDPPPRP